MAVAHLTDDSVLDIIATPLLRLRRLMPPTGQARLVTYNVDHIWMAPSSGDGYTDEPMVAVESDSRQTSRSHNNRSSATRRYAETTIDVTSLGQPQTSTWSGGYKPLLLDIC